MGKILQAIKKHYETGAFTARELSEKVKINQKVCSMVLKKYAMIEVLSCFSIREEPHFLYRTDEEIKANREDCNKIIDKYLLKQKKYKT